MNRPIDPAKLQQALAGTRTGMTAANLQAMAEMYWDNKSTQAVGAHFGVDKCTVRRYLVAAGVEMRKPGWINRFTPEFAQKVKDLKATGLTWHAVAKQLGICQTTIVKARKRGDI